MACASLILRAEEVISELSATGAYRVGHFVLPTGKHTDRYLQIPLALRHFEVSRRLCVGLARLLRSAPPIAAALPKVSIVSPPSGGIPVAFGLADTLSPTKIYWAERRRGSTLGFRQFVEIAQGERFILVDDVLRSGKTMTTLVGLVRESGGDVLGIGVIVDQSAGRVDLGGVPVYSLAPLKTAYFDKDGCPLCRRGEPAVSVEEFGTI